MATIIPRGRRAEPLTEPDMEEEDDTGDDYVEVLVSPTFHQMWSCEERRCDVSFVGGGAHHCRVCGVTVCGAHVQSVEISTRWIRRVTVNRSQLSAMGDTVLAHRPLGDPLPDTLFVKWACGPCIKSGWITSVSPQSKVPANTGQTPSTPVPVRAPSIAVSMTSAPVPSACPSVENSVAVGGTRAPAVEALEAKGEQQRLEPPNSDLLLQIQICASRFRFAIARPRTDQAAPASAPAKTQPQSEMQTHRGALEAKLSSVLSDCPYHWTHDEALQSRVAALKQKKHAATRQAAVDRVAARVMGEQLLQRDATAAAVVRLTALALQAEEAATDMLLEGEISAEDAVTAAAVEVEVAADMRCRGEAEVAAVAAVRDVVAALLVEAEAKSTDAVVGMAEQQAENATLLREWDVQCTADEAVDEVVSMASRLALERCCLTQLHERILRLLEVSERGGEAQQCIELLLTLPPHVSALTVLQSSATLALETTAAACAVVVTDRASADATSARVETLLSQGKAQLGEAQAAAMRAGKLLCEEKERVKAGEVARVDHGTLATMALTAVELSAEAELLFAAVRRHVCVAQESAERIRTRATVAEGSLSAAQEASKEVQRLLWRIEELATSTNSDTDTAAAVQEGRGAFLRGALEEVQLGLTKEAVGIAQMGAETNLALESFLANQLADRVIREEKTKLEREVARDRACELSEDEQGQRLAAAVIIKTHWRQHVDYKTTLARRHQSADLEWAARRVQAVVRGHVCRRSLREQNEKSARPEEEHVSHAVHDTSPVQTSVEDPVERKPIVRFLSKRLRLWSRANQTEEIPQEDMVTPQEEHTAVKDSAHRQIELSLGVSLQLRCMHRYVGDGDWGKAEVAGAVVLQSIWRLRRVEALERSMADRKRAQLQTSRDLEVQLEAERTRIAELVQQMGQMGGMHLRRLVRPLLVKLAHIRMRAKLSQQGILLLVAVTSAEYLSLDSSLKHVVVHGQRASEVLTPASWQKGELASRSRTLCAYASSKIQSGGHAEWHETCLLTNLQADDALAFTLLEEGAGGVGRVVGQALVGLRIPALLRGDPTRLPLTLGPQVCTLEGEKDSGRGKDSLRNGRGTLHVALKIAPPHRSHAGYLLKQTGPAFGQSMGRFKSRYFALFAGMLHYYCDEFNLNDPRGSMLCGEVTALELGRDRTREGEETLYVSSDTEAWFLRGEARDLRMWGRKIQYCCPHVALNGLDISLLGRIESIATGKPLPVLREKRKLFRASHDEYSALEITLNLDEVHVAWEERERVAALRVCEEKSLRLVEGVRRRSQKRHEYGELVKRRVRSVRELPPKGVPP
ncbi:hypothetical protein B484DRAFT_178868, partial [Ochromonadaceae sp. CCMP2298]